MKKILGLDLGTNSIGWALIEQDFENKQGKILGMGSRIIPMSQDILGDFGKGNSISQTAERTKFRSVRRLRERHLLRRERLHRVLNILDFLPAHYAGQIDFKKRLGQFLPDSEPKLAYNKGVFIFQKSFLEMLEDFKKHQPALLNDQEGNAKLIPYDWTLYYLRKKALTRKIEKEELAWIIIHFNQKRGYYQLRGEEEEENPSKHVELHSLKIIDVIADEPQKGKDEIWYSLVLENGWIYRRSSKTSLFDWNDKVRDFIVTTELNDDGTEKTDKEGVVKRSFRAPGDEDWTLRKKKTEQSIHTSGKTVGTYIYDTLLQNPKQKIRGKLVRTIERNFYKDELHTILSAQKEFHPEFSNEDLFNDCVRELYRNNESHQTSLCKRDITHLIISDIIFYQRPLKSKKSSIGNCSLEYRKYKNQEGLEVKEPVKAIPKSHPLFQEFRLWQWLANLSIYRNEDEAKMNDQFFGSTEDYQSLFDYLYNRKEISQEGIIKHLLEKTGLKGRTLSQEALKYRWNFVSDKVYPCNETRAQIASRLMKVEGISDDFLTTQIEFQLWHIIYSVSDRTEYQKALTTFANKNNLGCNSFVENFRKFPPFNQEYGSYSAKAIKKLLPLMRSGTHWRYEDFCAHTKIRINKLISGEYDETIRDRVREKSIHLTRAEDFQNIPLWLASYIVYDSQSTEKWNSVADLNEYLKNFRQHSLRNPIVEQVMTETLRVVRDIWMKYGSGAKDFFTEIHVELGRDMKNTADERRKISETVTQNENTNLRIKALLLEMLNDSQVENVRPYSPFHQEILKIYEDGALNFNTEIPDDIEKIRKKSEPSRSELQRYKLWLEQRYRSPYTGQVIPLNKLFTPEYQIEHIIPQSRYYDDSFTNKVICELAVNELKDNQTGLEFVKNHHGTTVEIGGGRSLRIYDETAYIEFVNEHYAKNRSKRNKLLMEDIPVEMIERQLNDTRYISKFISSVLSNIVRSKDKDDGVNSKNLIPGNGKITGELRQDWGLNDIWNELILPRFERMNVITGSSDFTSYNENHQKYLPTVPFALSKGFQKKRIDHRHHALDALIIACASRSHVNYLNNQHALDKTKSKRAKQEFREDLRAVLCFKKYQEGSDKNYRWQFKKPWDNFTADAKDNLEKIIVSFKQNLRVINKANNKYKKWVEKDGKLALSILPQIQGDSWAIRKSLHAPMPYGKITISYEILNIVGNFGKIDSIINETYKLKVYDILSKYKNVSEANRETKIKTKAYLKTYNEYQILLNDIRKYTFTREADTNKIQDINGKIDQIINILESYNDFLIVNQGYSVVQKLAFRTQVNKFRRRQPISELANRGNGGIKTIEDAIKFFDKIVDYKIREDLLNHLKNNENDLEKAFSNEGLEKFNLERPIPVFKLPIAESGTGRFSLGYSIGTRHKWVEADKGTNLFFAVYQDEKGKRIYETVPFNIVIERQKQGLSSVSELNEKGDKLLFHLSPNDLVYIPSKEESDINSPIDFSHLTKDQVDNIYKAVSFTGTTCFFVMQNVATSIINKVEFSALNKTEKSIDGIMIKEFCVKIKVDRLGNIGSLSKNQNPASDIFSNSSLANQPIEFEKPILKDPQGSYGDKINFFQSFEEAENFESRAIALQDPLQRLRDTVALIVRVFGFTREQLNSRFRDNRINFTQKG